MSMTDPVGDMLTRLRNAIQSRKAEVFVPKSRLKEQIASILKEEGFVDSVSSVDGMPQGLMIRLRYSRNGKQSAIQQIRRVSKPGQRKYAGTGEIPKVCSGLGVSILSTSQGIMADRQARKLGIGGEILCEVW